MSDKTGNIEASKMLPRLLAAVTEGLTLHSAEPLAPLLAEDVVWEGLEPGQICGGKREVIERLNRGIRAIGPLDRLESSLDADEVTVVATGEGLTRPMPDGTSVPRPSAGLVFRIESDKITHIQAR